MSACEKAAEWQHALMLFEDRKGCEPLGVLYSFPGAACGTQNPICGSLVDGRSADIQQLKFREEPGLGSHEHLVEHNI